MIGVGRCTTEHPSIAREGALPLQAATFPRQSASVGEARSVIAASPQAEVAGGHSENADEQRDDQSAPRTSWVIASS
jgi:hypothetical protein